MTQYKLREWKEGEAVGQMHPTPEAMDTLEDFILNLAKGAAPENTVSITVEATVTYYVVRPKTEIKTWSITIPPREQTEPPETR